VCTKAAIATLLILSVALLTGCNVSYGTDCETAQASANDTEAIADRRDITSDATSVRLQEDLRLANERASLAEERAELEKQKRQLAEERLKQPDNTGEDDKVEEPIDDQETGGS
jgi:hypothetical protein